jgi:hypothetical protein
LAGMRHYVEILYDVNKILVLTVSERKKGGLQRKYEHVGTLFMLINMNFMQNMAREVGYIDGLVFVKNIH